MKPLLSVVMITYSHEKYIEQAINGVFIQKTDFLVELIIADDCSPDNSEQIIKNIIEKSPENITVKYIRHKENKGMMPNFIWALEQCKGKYIALCEGDDYWTDPLKLQKQVDFLEENEGYVGCFTNVSIINSIGMLITEKQINITKKTYFEHIDMPIYAPTLTMIFKREGLKGLNTSLNTSAGGDTFTLVWLTKFGRLKFIDEVTSCYRIHEGGVWSSLDNENQTKHLISTRISCLRIANNELIPKLFALLFNLLFRFSGKEYKLSFIETKKQIFRAFKENSDKLSVKTKITIYSLFLLLTIPRLHNRSIFRKLRSKFVNIIYPLNRNE